MADHDKRRTADTGSTGATGSGQLPGQVHPAGEQGGEAGTTPADPGLDREVGDINDSDDEDALPGRMGGGLAGG
jgi:hypothetical protein